MRILLILTSISLFIASACFAAKDQQDLEQAPAPQAKKELPNLGSCDEYTDYSIYKCIPFKCRMQVANFEGVYREMETFGYQNGLCLHNFSFIIRNKKYPVGEIRMKCKLSENGRLEMANLFTLYKRGDLSVYANPPVSQIVNQECQKQ